MGAWYNTPIRANLGNPAANAQNGISNSSRQRKVPRAVAGVAPNSQPSSYLICPARPRPMSLRLSSPTPTGPVSNCWRENPGVLPSVPVSP